MKSLIPFPIIGSFLLAFTMPQAPALGQESPVPGPEHQALKKLEGTWSAKIKMEDDESDGIVTYKMECGGLWLISDFQGKLGDQRFQGRGMDGYDPKKQKYVSVWVDSMSTQPMLFEGTHDQEKKTTTMTGEAPGLDGKPAQHKLVTHFPDEDHHTFTMYVIDDGGGEHKIMTIEYTRKK